MRETLDELWILDLGGDNLGARKSENVFAIQTPVAIAVGIRSGEGQRDAPATVRYARLDGSREEKFAALEAIEGFADVTWHECFDGWTEPFLPRGAGDFYAWPLLTDIFPWQHSGVQFKRTWPIAADRETLARRWRALTAAAPEERAALFRETRDRKITKPYADVVSGEPLSKIAQLDGDARMPTPAPYAFRSFDRQFCLVDNRVGDFLRPALWRADGPRQLYLTSILHDVLGPGPAATATHLIPDMHHFSGRGGKDVLPLWRDAAASAPNVTAGLLEALGRELETPVTPEDLFAYCYALLAGPDYIDRYAEELELPGPHVPVTRDQELFRRAVELGRELVRAYTVSGLDVVGSWLDYRMLAGAGRRSSELDKIRPTTWPAAYTEELLRLLWILERTVALRPYLNSLLEEIATGPVLRADDLPTPSPEERLAPDE